MSTQSRFRAFFLFSTPVDPEVAAERFTALVAGVGAGPIPPVPAPATFALAVPSGDGEGIRSLLESLSLDREDEVVDAGSVLAGEDCRG